MKNKEVLQTKKNAPQDNNAPSWMDTLSYEAETYRIINSESGRTHHTYHTEQELMKCIREMDADRAIQKLIEFPASSYGKVSRDMKKQSEYLAVITVSLVCRAAIEAGLNEFDAYDLNDLYLQKISVAHSEEEYTQIIFECIRGTVSYIQKSQKYKNLSYHIEECCQYVARHLTQPILVSDIAAYTGLTPTYLSKLFSESVHMTLKEYILRERIKASRNMLRFSDYSIREISHYLNFSSQSHFTSVFKRITGTTPEKYRQGFLMFR